MEHLQREEPFSSDPYFRHYFTTISGHFFANYINIFHKTEVLKNILWCQTCLNLNWIKKSDINTNYFLFIKKSTKPSTSSQNWRIRSYIHLNFRHVRHLKINVRTSVLWKILMLLAKKWLGISIYLPFPVM